jgi:hypothetical protein
MEKVPGDSVSFTRTYVRCLEEYEGDLLTEIRVGDDVYVEKWCDMDDRFSRTMAAKSSAADIEAYLKGELTLYALLTNHSNGVYFLIDGGLAKEWEPDDDWDDRYVYRAISIKHEDVPNTYWPDISAKYEPALAPRFLPSEG